MSNADPGRARPVFQWLAQLFALMGKESKQIIRALIWSRQSCP